MKGLKKELENKYFDFGIVQNRDGDFTISNLFEEGKLWVNLVFNERGRFFRVDGFVRFEAVEQVLEPYIYDLNPAYRKHSATITLCSERTNEFAVRQETELFRIFSVIDFVFEKMKLVTTYKSVIEVMDSVSFKQRKLYYDYIPVRCEMKRIAIAKVLGDRNIDILIENQMKHVEQFKLSGAFNYQGLSDFVNSI